MSAVRDLPDGAEAAAILDAARPRAFVLPDRGVTLAALDWGGTGPIALLHHANGFCKGVWGLVAEGLKHRYRVIAIDARGHGDSTVPSDPDAYAWAEFALDVAAVGEALRTEQGAPIALGIGHSFGGTALLGAASRHPDLFARLLLVDPVTPPPPDSAPTAERQARLVRIVEGARKRRAEWPSRAEARAWWAERAFFASWDPRALDLYVLDGLRARPDGSVVLKCMPETEATIFGHSGGIDVFALAAAVRTPTRILWAERGDFSRPVYERMARGMANAVIETVAAGHLVTMERPDLVVEAALRPHAAG